MVTLATAWGARQRWGDPTVDGRKYGPHRARPTYDQIGVWGAVAITILRTLQGLGVVVEWGGAVAVATEWGTLDKSRRLPQVAGPIWFAAWPAGGAARADRGE